MKRVLFDFRGSHACQFGRDLHGHMRDMDYIIVYTELRGHVHLKYLQFDNLFYLNNILLFNNFENIQRAPFSMTHVTMSYMYLLKYLPFLIMKLKQINFII